MAAAAARLSLEVTSQMTGTTVSGKGATAAAEHVDGGGAVGRECVRHRETEARAAAGDDGREALGGEESRGAEVLGHGFGWVGGE